MITTFAALSPAGPKEENFTGSFREKRPCQVKTTMVSFEHNLIEMHLLSRVTEGTGPMKSGNRGNAAVPSPAGVT